MIHIDSEDISVPYQGTVTFSNSISGIHKLKYSSFQTGPIPWCWPGSDALYIQQGSNFYTVSLGTLLTSDDSAIIASQINAVLGAGSVAVVRTAAEYTLTFTAQTSLLWKDARMTLNQIYNNERTTESGTVFILGGESVDPEPDLIEFHIDAATTNIQSGRGDVSGDILVSRSTQIENKLTFSDTTSMSISVQRLNAQTTCPTDRRWHLLFVRE